MSRLNHVFHASASLVILAVASACSAPGTPPDDSSSGLPRDGGEVEPDSGAPADAGQPVDSGHNSIPPDAGISDSGVFCTNVAHIGDSTSVGMAAYLPNEYSRVGATARIDASGGRSIVERVNGEPNGYEAAQAARAAGFKGCWVIALGTNDTANVAAGSNVTRTYRINRMMSIINGEPVLWVETETTLSTGYWKDANMVLWNNALEEAQSRFSNMRIYQWAAVAQKDWFSTDGIHYTTTGYKERARRIADSFRQLLH